MLNVHKNDPLMGCEIHKLSKNEWDDVKNEIMMIEHQFSDNLRDSEEDLRSILDYDDNVFLLLKKNDKIIGYAAGARLEKFQEIHGIKEDSHYGLDDTFYLESWIVEKNFRSTGLGTHLLNHLFLRVKSKKILYLSGHFADDYGEKLGGIQQMTFSEWYETNKRYKYCRIHLSEASWIESCKTMISIESILAGFSSVIFAVLFSLNFSETILFALLAIIPSIGLFIYSAEKSSDAIDERIPISYVKTLVYYNFAVVFLFVSMSIVVYDFIERTSIDLPDMLKFLILIAIAAGGSFRWFKDGVWLLRDDQKMEYLRALEKGMRFTV